MSDAASLIVTEAAAARIAAMGEKKGNTNLMLRVTISGGGCSGFQTTFDLDDTTGDEDVTFEKDGSKVVTDTASLALIENATVDYKDDLMGARFQLDIPNAESMCGCGTSFSLSF